MGLFDFIRGELVDIIEWVDTSTDTVIWKFPDRDNEIKNGAQLTVRESQVAILLDQGRVAEQGTHAELLRRGRLYAGMWARQAREREEALAAE